MKKENFILIVEKFAKGEATSHESKVIETFLDIHKDDNIIPNFQNNERKNILEKVKRQLPKDNHNSFIYAKIAISAAIVVVCFLSFQFFEKPTIITHLTAKGEKKEIILQDGSVVTLNANSAISYPSNFEVNRNVKLNGQAFFKVAKAEEYPFTVTTEKIKVQVLGTSFDINANSYSKPTVKVVSGLVKVSANNNINNSTIIRKNEQVIFENNKFNYAKTASDNTIAWTNNTIHLHNNTLQETARILEDWYNIKISFKSKNLEKLTISGKFRNEKIENVIKSIALVKDLKIDTITPKHILISKKTNLN